MGGDLQSELEDLGLGEYASACKEAGFLDWDSLANTTEFCLAALNMRLGDRRKLQREIARRQLWPDNVPLPNADQLIHQMSTLGLESCRQHDQPRRTLPRWELGQKCPPNEHDISKTVGVSEVMYVCRLVLLIGLQTWTSSLQELEKVKATALVNGKDSTSPVPKCESGHRERTQA